MTPSGFNFTDTTHSPTFLAFDLEISKIIPGDFNDWKTHRPLGISCAATLIDGKEPILWASQTSSGYASQMTREDCSALVNYLQSAVERGCQIFTWNGLGFDFDVLAEESGCESACRNLALHHSDMMFQVFCQKGYPLALNKAARGMGLPGKLDGVSGEQAPILWQQCQYQQVLDYVAQDARTTLALAKTCLQSRCLKWTSNTGKPQSLPLPKGWLAVNQALRLPEPDTSWMSSPIKRSDYIRWTKPVLSNPIETLAEKPEIDHSQWQDLFK